MKWLMLLLEVVSRLLRLTEKKQLEKYQQELDNERKKVYNNTAEYVNARWLHKHSDNSDNNSLPSDSSDAGDRRNEH